MWRDTMKSETEYLIITKKSYYIIQGYTGPQFRHHSLFTRTLSWFINIFHIKHAKMPKDFTCIYQYFPNLKLDDTIVRGFIVMKKVL